MFMFTFSDFTFHFEEFPRYYGDYGDNACQVKSSYGDNPSKYEENKYGDNHRNREMHPIAPGKSNGCNGFQKII